MKNRYVYGCATSELLFIFILYIHGSKACTLGLNRLRHDIGHTYLNHQKGGNAQM